MNKKFSRTLRVAQEIKKEIAIILQRKIKDPRLGMMTTVSSVKMSNDLAYAKVFITCLHDPNRYEVKNSIIILQAASGFIRSLLAKAINLRVIPELIFLYDRSLVDGIYISNILTKVVNNNDDVVISNKLPQTDILKN